MKRIFVIIGAFVILIVILTVYLTGSRTADGGVLVLSGTVEAVEIDLAFKTSGRVDYIIFEEADDISKGDTISELTHREITAQIQLAEDQINMARARLKTFRVEMETVQRNLKKVNNLLPSGGATVGRKEDLEDKIRGLNASIEAAQSAVKSAISQRDYLHVIYENEFLISPIDGTVLLKSAEPDEILSPGQPVLTVADLGNLKIKVYIPESFLGKIVHGQPVEIEVDSHPGEIFEGKISRISDKAEFTPKFIQTKQERVKTVFAVTISTSDHGGVLKPGIPCDVTIRFTP